MPPGDGNRERPFICGEEAEEPSGCLPFYFGAPVEIVDSGACASTRRGSQGEKDESKDMQRERGDSGCRRVR